MKKMFLAVAVFALVMMPFMAMADPIAAPLTGTRTSAAGGGITATNQWNNNFQLYWNINFDPVTKYYTYNYTISGIGNPPGSVSLTDKALSHWILQVTEPSKLSDFESPNPTISAGPTVFEPSALDDNGVGSNPGMPGNLYGIKWNTTGDPLVFSVSFMTLKDPVWGDFYAKDGNSGGQGGGTPVYAYNTDFGKDPSTLTDFTGKIATPDGAVVPLPGSLLLLGSGILGLVGLRRKLF